MRKRQQGRSPKRKYTTQEALARVAWHSYKNNCRKRGRKFDLSYENFYSLAVRPCHYCGSPPQNKSRRKRTYGDAVFYYNGIDRKDNGRGYHMDNLVPCCARCNGIKSDRLSYEEMLIVSSALTNFAARQELLRGAHGRRLAALMRLALPDSTNRKPTKHRP